MTDTESFEKVSYVALEEEPLTWYEWFFGKSEPEIEADPRSKTAKYKVTQQIKRSVNHKLIQKPQKDTPFPHTQSVIQTDQKMEDKTNELPSPYKQVKQDQKPGTSPLKNPPQVPIKKKLHPSMSQLRRKVIKDDLDI